MQKQKIATVFGGTGLVGHALVQALVEKGYKVRVPTRDLEKANDLKLFGKVGQVVPVKACVRTDNSVEACVAGASLVVNLIGVPTQNKQNSFKAIHVEVAARIARLAQQEGVKKLIHLSSIGASEGAKLPFLRTKAMGEAAVCAFYPEALILRPSVIYGPRDCFLNKLALFARHIFYVPLIDGGQTKFQPVYVGDIAKAIINACDIHSSNGKTITCVGPDVYSWEEIWQLLEDISGVRRWKLKVSSKLIYIKALLLEFWFWPPFTRQHIDLLMVDWVTEVGEQEGLKALGVVPKKLKDVWPTYLVKKL